ncbi:MAG TPA: 3-dehydroquinate synthase [Polyangiaceae bacterium]|nr:3-dehydroquinate synthase [Polyangiaceae bacterium]
MTQSSFELTAQRISVGFEYPVYFTEGCLRPGNGALVHAVSHKEPARRHRAVVVIDGGLAAADPEIASRVSRYVAAHTERLDLAASPLVVPGGEASKNDPALVTRVQSWLSELGIDRQSVVVIVGGGAVLDVAGYAAATTHRGVRVVRLPTTVLSQCDSGVGVKNGVNAFGKKNFLGTFAPPFAVVNDTSFLKTLSLRDKKAGMSEAVKVALVRDRGFFHWIAEHARELSSAEPGALDALIRKSADLHLHHIRTSGDPFELGSARPLDFGHWAAHKLETLTRHRLRHGECVAIGMAIDTVYSARAGIASVSVQKAVLTTLDELGLTLWDDALDLAGPGGERAVLAGLGEFREHLGGELTVTLLSDIGAGLEVNSIDENMVALAIDDLRHRAVR